MSRCSNYHTIEDGKGSLRRISTWRCPECQGKSIAIIGYIILAFSVPILYGFFGGIATHAEEGEKSITVGFFMIMILWWEALIMFFLYRKEIKELKKRLVEVESIANIITKDDLSEISELYEGSTGKLKEYLQDAKKDFRSAKELSEITSHNISALDSTALPFEEYETFWKNCEQSNTIYKNWLGLRCKDPVLAPILFIASLFLPVIGVIIASFFN